MRVAVTGGRDFDDEDFVFECLDKFNEMHGITLLIQGDATGADSLCKKWAKERNIDTDDCPADWDDITAPGADVRMNKSGKLYNRKAGTSRNLEMIAKRPAYLLAFPGGTGTNHMRKHSHKAGILLADYAKVYEDRQAGQLTLF